MADSVKIKITGDDTGFKDTLSGLGSTTGSVFKGIMTSQLVTAGFSIIKRGFETITTAAFNAGKGILSAFGDYEQLVGGVETLFKESDATVMRYANNAFKTAGLSANEYMETVTSFSASLISSLDGDTAKAAESANLAITDMSDNANKMGTSMASIQSAYQGFAKMNYTMLDNLKIGYGKLYCRIKSRLTVLLTGVHARMC